MLVGAQQKLYFVIFDLCLALRPWEGTAAIRSVGRAAAATRGLAALLSPLLEARLEWRKVTLSVLVNYCGCVGALWIRVPDRRSIMSISAADALPAPPG